MKETTQIKIDEEHLRNQRRIIELLRSLVQRQDDTVKAINLVERELERGKY